MRRIGRHDVAKRRGRGVRFSGRQLQHTQVVPGARGVRVDGEQLLELRAGFVSAAELRVDHAEVVQQFRIAVARCAGAFERARGAGEVSGFAQHGSELGLDVPR